MIVREDKTFEINSLFSNTNWYENEPSNIIVEDGTELAEKIKIYAPYFVWNEDKTDIIPTEKPMETPSNLPPSLEERVSAIEDLLLTMI